MKILDIIKNDNAELVAENVKFSDADFTATNTKDAIKENKSEIDGIKNDESIPNDIKSIKTLISSMQKHKFTQDDGTAINCHASDFNSIVKSGLYMGSTMSNSPDNSDAWFFIEVKTHNNIWVVQTATSFTDPNLPKWERSMNNGEWQPWRSL